MVMLYKKGHTMFWDRFVKLCESCNMKPTPLGKELGVSSAAINKWKNGAMPNAEILVKIADRFDVSVDYLLCREFNKHENNEFTIVNSSERTINSSENINEQKLIEKFRLLTYEQQIRIISDVIRETENNSEKQQ